ncbi:hypothetical protein [Blastococcus sp. PRF04-17]|uniref:hypothetical protein n=1 Tax=Blastococcus sp. PRF04-17 TaxID=2933797 RepID=UPI001FF1066C|nr:hypothetical protein [Blastococcus sp. PRF04-17]UOY02339.1 hypothetical protein MVA48_02845 [Blastococcus sp. PRF04-17]
MFLLFLAVPGLLVVVLGYAVGHGLWSAIAGPGGAEPAGWTTGLLLLAIVTWSAVRRLRAGGRP